jgi:hypothetical protein
MGDTPHSDAVNELLADFFGVPLDPHKQASACSDVMQARFMHSWVWLCSLLTTVLKCLTPSSAGRQPQEKIMLKDEFIEGQEAIGINMGKFSRSCLF